MKNFVCCYVSYKKKNKKGFEEKFGWDLREK